MSSRNPSLSKESPFVEIPFILDKDQMIRLEMLAAQRGQTVGSLLRHLLRAYLTKTNTPDLTMFKTSA
jgi:hypothetical protein